MADLSVAIQIQNLIQGKPKLWKFLNDVLPDQVPRDKEGLRTQSKEDFIADVFEGVHTATMAIRVTWVFRRVLLKLYSD